MTPPERGKSGNERDDPTREVMLRLSHAVDDARAVSRGRVTQDDLRLAETYMGQIMAALQDRAAMIAEPATEESYHRSLYHHMAQRPRSLR